MKKALFIIAIILYSISAYTQTNKFLPDGNVGIGTINPDRKLHVSGGDVLLDNGQWYSAKNASGTIIPILGMSYNNNIYLGDVFGGTSSDLIFRSRGNDILNISASGNVGIGTATPGAPLHIVKSSVPSTSVSLQDWAPSIVGYDLVLSNFNSPHGIDYRFTQLHAGTPIPV